MSGCQSLLASACVTAAVLVAACAAGTPGAAGPVAPTLTSESAAATAVLVVQVDAVCAGRESDIRVYVDHLPIGVTNPGEPGVSELVSVGDHQLTAVSQRGTQWGPFPATVPNAGHVERLGCMPADAL